MKLQILFVIATFAFPTKGSSNGKVWQSDKNTSSTSAASTGHSQTSTSSSYEAKSGRAFGVSRWDRKYERDGSARIPADNIDESQQLTRSFGSIQLQEKSSSTGLVRFDPYEERGKSGGNTSHTDDYIAYNRTHIPEGGQPGYDGKVRQPEKNTSSASAASTGLSQTSTSSGYEVKSGRSFGVSRWDRKYERDGSARMPADSIDESHQLTRSSRSAQLQEKSSTTGPVRFGPCEDSSQSSRNTRSTDDNIVQNRIHVPEVGHLGYDDRGLEEIKPVNEEQGCENNVAISSGGLNVEHGEASNANNIRGGQDVEQGQQQLPKEERAMKICIPLICITVVSIVIATIFLLIFHPWRHK